jgi:hypothetical protein
MQVAAARFTPASLMEAATRARAPGSFSSSMTRSNGIDVLLSAGLRHSGLCQRLQVASVVDALVTTHVPGSTCADEGVHLKRASVSLEATPLGRR